MLQIPLAGAGGLDEHDIQRELDNNAQGILGYVVRWIDQGVGCSKVPDIDNIGLMEDRATLRISASTSPTGSATAWSLNSRCGRPWNAWPAWWTTRTQVIPATYPWRKTRQRCLPAACDLVFLGTKQPSGYTEPLLHQRRREFKAQ